MEKIVLKPIAQELFYRSNEENTFSDVLSVSPTQKQERFLGNLYVIGHIKYGDEDMGYLVSLISSLAKREYYSDEALGFGNPKTAFEHVLKKLNEVLVEFFQNKKFNLNIGLVVVAGESIYLSKLGRFKVFLGRKGEIIDIFNNVNLFQKNHIEESEFSNIISGKVKLDDAIFAFFPSRSISARKKQIKEILLQDPQSEFIEKFKNLSKNAKNFFCCGIHLEIKKIKEIISPAATIVKTSPDIKAKKSADAPTADFKKETGQKDAQVDADQSDADKESIPKEPLAMNQSPPLLRDMSLVERKNILKKSIGLMKKIISVGSANKKTRIIFTAVILVLILSSIILTKTLFISEETKFARNTIAEARDNFKLAQIYLGQNDITNARNLISNTLASLSSISIKKSEDMQEIHTSLNGLLDKIDLVVAKKPKLVADLSAVYVNDEKLNSIATEGTNLFAFSSAGSLVKISEGEVENLETLKGFGEGRLFSENGKVSIFNGSDLLAVFDTESKKVSQYFLKNPLQTIDSDFYERNLYILANNSIFKYPDAFVGGVERQQWLKDALVPNSELIAVDGNVYAFSADGFLTTYFKGKKISELQLNILPSAGSGLLTKKDLDFLAYIDPGLKKVMIFSKEQGELIKSYKADNLIDIISWDLAQDGKLYLLSSDQKIWEIMIP